MSTVNRRENCVSRRDFVAEAAIVGRGLVTCGPLFGKPAEVREVPHKNKALVAITLDLEMVRNFPKWEDTHWDYEKGNLQPEMKKYALEAARRVKARGGVIHFFLVCRALEQENVDWLKELIQTGHSIGNHTYDHVYLLAT